ncbi:MAG: tetratricopeptide repeat protein [Gallionella sp.]|nr:tetratricopeptide repeat protein [Gallionella sp.]
MFDRLINLFSHKETPACGDDSVRQNIQLLAHPDHAKESVAYKEQGDAHATKGHLEQAIACYQHAIALDPNHAAAYNNLATALLKFGRLTEADACYRRLLQITPGDADAHNNLGVTFQHMGRLAEAEASYRKSIQVNPEHANAHNNLGAAFLKLGRLTEAEASCRYALQINPDNADAHNNLGNIFREQGRTSEAETSFRSALQIDPNNADTNNNLGNALKDMGRLAEAEDSYRRALGIDPAFAKAYSNLLFLYSYQALLDPKKYLIQARKWEHACLPRQDRQAARYRIFQRAPLARRRLKVGYVSGDFRQHAVSYFIEQLFTHHDRKRVELFAYSNSVIQDAVTIRFHALAEHWVQIAGLSDAVARDRIEADDIDVLIDLSGHTSGNRMGVFARRAAPVQAYYLGYFASTGLTEMDYWIGDEIVTPPGTDSHFSEQVWRLPRVSWSYDGKDAPLPDWRPPSDHTVWMGSFNQLGKLTPATLALWAKVLHALPEGRILLKTKELADAANRQRILDDMCGYGIPSDRIELQDGSITPSWREHMAYYNRLDIVLDPVGAMGGVTSTCDALWMGAPVITLKGDRVTSRATAAILNAIDHPEWIAHAEAEYIDKVVALSRDVEQRSSLRFSQREHMGNSPLCDAKDLTMNLEHAYVEMFNRWLNKKNNTIDPV